MTDQGDSHQTARKELFKGLQIWSRVRKSFEPSPQAIRLFSPNPRKEGPKNLTLHRCSRTLKWKTQLATGCSKVSDLLEDAAPEPLTQKWRRLWRIH